MTEEKREYNKIYYADPVNRERTQKYGEKYRTENREQLNEDSRTRYRKKCDSGEMMIAWIEGRFSNTPCLDCNRVFPWECMDFDHRPDETKSFGIGQKGPLKVTSERISEVMKEIDKCDLVCACCHRTRTKTRRQHE